MDSQQLKYQKDKSMLLMLNVLKIGHKLKVDTNMTCHRAYMPGKLDMSTIRGANLEHS